MKLWTLTLVVSYLLGSIPFGYLLVRFLRKEDVRATGSGNIGATNVARAMAEGIRAVSGSAIGVSITGLAGPASGDGPDADKPVGLIFIGLSDGEDTQVKQIQIPGDRDRVRLWATQHALELLRRTLE